MEAAKSLMQPWVAPFHWLAWPLEQSTFRWLAWPLEQSPAPCEGRGFA